MTVIEALSVVVSLVEEHVYTPSFVGYSVAVMCSVDVILPSENEKVPALGI